MRDDGERGCIAVGLCQMSFPGEHNVRDERTTTGRGKVTCLFTVGPIGPLTFQHFKSVPLVPPKKFYDSIPPLLEKKYLKTIYNCHSCSGTLDIGDLVGDGVITVLDIDAVIR